MTPLMILEEEYDDLMERLELLEELLEMCLRLGIFWPLFCGKFSASSPGRRSCKGYRLFPVTSLKCRTVQFELHCNRSRARTGVGSVLKGYRLNL